MEETLAKKAELAFHLEELRKRILYCLGFFAGVFVLCLFFQAELMKIATLPHLWVVGWLKEKGITATKRLLGLRYTAPIFAYLKLSLLGALFLSVPFCLYQLWCFISQGLFFKERKYALRFGSISLLLFVAGVLFGYFVLIPYGLYFLACYGDPGIIKLEYSIGEYLNLLILLSLTIGMIFELPLLMVFLSTIGIADREKFCRWRKFAIVIIFFASAILTPGPDIFSQCMMAIPLCLLYEIGIIFSGIFSRKEGRYGEDTDSR
jgi:Tat protein translocase TatC